MMAFKDRFCFAPKHNTVHPNVFKRLFFQEYYDYAALMILTNVFFFFLIQIEEAQTMRNNAIQKCIKMQIEKTKSLMAKREQDPEDYAIRKKLRNEQSTVRLFCS